MRKLGIWALILVPLLFILVGGCTQYNKIQNKEIDFEREDKVRVAQYDKMWKILKQKGIVAKTNDSSFQRVVDAVMAGRKDGEGLAMKWIQEQNPTAQFSEVSSMYKDLSRTIEAERNSFFEQEKKMAEIVADHDRLRRTFPGSIWAMVFGTKPINYKPIQSSRTEDVMKTGKDDDVSVF